MHTPVLVNEVLETLCIKKGGKYIDATYGEGGHSREIVKQGGEVLAIEWDEESLKIKVKSSKLDRIKLVWGNFANIESIAKKNDFYPVDGILFDLGLSMEQISKSARGFSYKGSDEILDMRISQTQKKTAWQIINSSSQYELYEIFSKNSEEIDSWAISIAIAKAYRIKKIMRVGDLIEVLESINKRDKEEKVFARIFQSLRIEVNDEFANLKRGLGGAIKILKKEGRIGVITFHSTEDRIVKNFIKEGGLKLISGHTIKSKKNLKFERSATLRVFGSRAT